MLTGAAVIFLVNVVSSWLKRFVVPRFGRLGVQVLVFVAAAVGASFYTFKGQIAGIQEFLTSAFGIFSLSVAFYEVILSRFSWFKGVADESIS